MSSKKKTPTRQSTSTQTLKIGSRVRCTDDHVEGRIVWANAVSVKLRWDDGEQVMWRRDSLAGRPIEILEASGDVNEQAATCLSEQSAAELPAEHAAADSVSTEKSRELIATVSTELSEAEALEQPLAAGMQAEEPPPSVPDHEAHEQPEQIEEQSEAAVATKRKRKTKNAADDGKDKKVSALDAAVKVLSETGKAMSCLEMIEAMAAKGYWTSPGGKTPQATLYSAIAREITAKGAHSRFVKAERGKFARNEPA